MKKILFKSIITAALPILSFNAFAAPPGMPDVNFREHITCGGYCNLNVYRWDPVPNATEYVVESYLPAYDSWKLETHGSSTVFTTNIVSAKRVKACNADGCSDWDIFY